MLQKSNLSRQTSALTKLAWLHRCNRGRRPVAEKCIRPAVASQEIRQTVKRQVDVPITFSKVISLTVLVFKGKSAEVSCWPAHTCHAPTSCFS